MQRHGCDFAQALDALAAQLGPPTAHDIRRALQTHMTVKRVLEAERTAA
jgi:hypothetical protein